MIRGTNLKTWIVISVFVLAVVLLACTVASFADQPIVDWWLFDGGSPPGAAWTIEPNSPTRNDVLHFTGYTDTITNISCALVEFGGGPPTLIIDNVAKTIELEFHPLGGYCWQYWDPVYVYVEGQFGPLADGDWLFFCDHPKSSFSIPFRVSWLKVLDPDGGEALPGGSTYTIGWVDFRSDGNFPGNYVLDYSSDNGQNWTPVDSNSVSSTCSYDWVLPSTNSDHCLIRVVDAKDPNVSDISDGTFTIYECTLPYDLNGDCFVDFLDFSLLASDWLRCGNPFDPNCTQ